MVYAYVCMYVCIVVGRNKSLVILLLPGGLVVGGGKGYTAKGPKAIKVSSPFPGTRARLGKHLR